MRYRLTLYLASHSKRSRKIRLDVEEYCKGLLGEYQLQVIYISEFPQLCSSRDIFASPTLVREFPEPECRVIGDLSDTGLITDGLDLDWKKG